MPRHLKSTKPITAYPIRRLTARVGRPLCVVCQEQIEFGEFYYFRRWREVHVKCVHNSPNADPNHSSI